VFGAGCCLLLQQGHDVFGVCDIDENCRIVLQAQFKDARIENNLITFGNLPRRTTMVMMGFPCTVWFRNLRNNLKDVSSAGLQKGLSGAETVKVFHLFKVLEQSRPVEWVLLEV
jgi:site-specific DNA-cytosine methylase